MVEKETVSSTHDLKSLDLKLEYNTEDDDIITDFYGPCLSVSSKYDRAVGYFRANIYRELGEELLDFVMKVGKIRVCCSPDIPERDEEAAREGYKLREKRSEIEDDVSLLDVFEEMASNPDELDCLNMLRLLIEMEMLDLYVAIRTGGIYHRKIGAFYDRNGNVVVFSGSGNETPSAIYSADMWGNDEEFDIYRSWGSKYEDHKIMKKTQYLEDLFNGGVGGTVVRPLNKIEREYLSKFRSFSSLEECREGAKGRSPSLKKKMKVSRGKSPYPFQLQAIENWKDAGYVGMLSMATGTGKTLTALFAIKEFLNKGCPILILVPSNLLLNQWFKSIKEMYPDVPVLLAGGRHNWKKEPKKKIYISDIDRPRIVLATMQTASTEGFMEFFGQAKNPILVADEAHRLGSCKFRRILDIDFRGTLGLSATPERLFDREGSLVLEKAFGERPVYELPIGGSVVFENGKEMPILGNLLSRYYYYFEIVDFSEEELEEWNNLTEKIKRAININSSTENSVEPIIDIDERVKQLFIKRARIAKNARSKISVVSKIISEKYPSDGHWIIYCDNLEQLGRVVSDLRKDNPIDVLEYHSGMSEGERKRVVDFFENNPSILVSIKCLDEGVDIPRADGAVILASSTNSREYIQRRGRVLRQAKGKEKATIVDVIVLPKIDRKDEYPLDSIIRSELARAWSFANYAEDKDIKHELWNLCIRYEIDPEMERENSIQSEEMED